MQANSLMSVPSATSVFSVDCLPCLFLVRDTLEAWRCQSGKDRFILCNHPQSAGGVHNTKGGPCRRSSFFWFCPQQGLRFCSASGCLLKICTKIPKSSLFQTQCCSLLLNTKQGCPRTLYQQRTADRNGWWEDKFMAFSHLETYLTLMQIFFQYSCEAVPQMNLHLTEQQGGPVPCSSMPVGSGSKWGPVWGTEGFAPCMLGIEVQWFLCTMQWILGLWVGLLCVGTTWW